MIFGIPKFFNQNIIQRLKIFGELFNFHQQPTSKRRDNTIILRSNFVQSQQISRENHSNYDISKLLAYKAAHSKCSRLEIRRSSWQQGATKLENYFGLFSNSSRNRRRIVRYKCFAHFLCNIFVESFKTHPLLNWTCRVNDTDIHSATCVIRKRTFCSYFIDQTHSYERKYFRVLDESSWLSAQKL